jgi:hypothetical protein
MSHLAPASAARNAARVTSCGTKIVPGWRKSRVGCRSLIGILDRKKTRASGSRRAATLLRSETDLRVGHLEPRSEAGRHQRGVLGAKARHLGFGRVVALEVEVPIMLVNLV